MLPLEVFWMIFILDSPVVSLKVSFLKAEIVMGRIH